MVKANILGYVSNDGKKHQSGLVVDRGGDCSNGICRTEQRPCENYQRIQILGAIGNTARENRDDKRVLCRYGIAPTLKAHIGKEKPLAVKRYDDRRT